jgi:hypothetical protein
MRAVTWLTLERPVPCLHRHCEGHGTQETDVLVSAEATWDGEWLIEDEQAEGGGLLWSDLLPAEREHATDALVDEADRLVEAQRSKVEALAEDAHEARRERRTA